MKILRKSEEIYLLKTNGYLKGKQPFYFYFGRISDFSQYDTESPGRINFSQN